MNEMHELITVQAFDRAFTIACLVWLIVCAAIALVANERGGRAQRRVWSLAALLGPLAICLWRFYSWMVRAVPETGYVGLHKVSVFAVNLLVFLAVGAALGVVFGRICRKAG